MLELREEAGLPTHHVDNVILHIYYTTEGEREGEKSE
jgi:hypothetical protein